MALPVFSMQELIEAGVHFGHKTKRWNPRMAPYIYGEKNNIHIINLGKTVPLLQRSLKIVRETVANNGRVLFVGTKRQASIPVMEAAKRCGQYYINQRWLGGLLTNWKTIQVSIKRLRELETQLNDTSDLAFTKKELLSMTRERDKLEASLGGIKEMAGRPDVIFIIDTNKEELAVNEAKKLGIPIIAVIDSNSSDDGIDYPIPGNDDSTRAIKLYCRLISDAVLDGIQASLTHSDVDAGESEVVPADFTATPQEAANDDAPKAEEKAPAKGKAAKKAPTVEVKKKPTRKKAEPKAEKEAETAEKPAKKAAPKKAAKAKKEDKADAKDAK